MSLRARRAVAWLRPRHVSSRLQGMEWPSLPYEAWKDTHATLHRWLQIVGKVRLAQTPWINHSWHVPFYLTASGLTTSPIPYGARLFQFDFDFIDQRLVLRTSEGRRASFELAPQPVAQFYARVMGMLRELGIDVRIVTTPTEVQDAVPFEQDMQHRTYQPEYGQRFWCALLQSDRVFKQFRCCFTGKASPVHFFWGDADLALTFFSGRKAEPPSEKREHMPQWVLQDAYSQESCTWGFWAGGDKTPYAMYFAYAYPEPPGFKQAAITPRAAHYESQLGKFVLPYEEVRRSSAPDSTLTQFLQSTYDACSKLGHWHREALHFQRPH
jgi:Family of unknown function (DUF5996)